MHCNLCHGWDRHTGEWHCCSCQGWFCYRVRVLCSYECWMDTLKWRIRNSHFLLLTIHNSGHKTQCVHTNPRWCQVPSEKETTCIPWSLHRIASPPFKSNHFAESHSKNFWKQAEVNLTFLWLFLCSLYLAWKLSRRQHVQCLLTNCKATKI